MFRCANCTYCTHYVWNWQRHATSSHHDLFEDYSPSIDSDSQTSLISRGGSVNTCQRQGSDIHNCLSDDGLISEGDESQISSTQNSLSWPCSQSLDQNSVLQGSISPPNLSSPPRFPAVNGNDTSDWHSFYSRIHCQLVLL